MAEAPIDWARTECYTAGRRPSFDGQATDEVLSRCGALTHHVAEHQAFRDGFKASQIREGWNEVVVFNGSMGSAAR